MKSILLSLLLFVGSVCCASGASLMLPFSGGQTWSCDQGNNDTPTHSGRLYYAWDFNLGSTSDLGLPVVAPASGYIVYARNSNSDWGNTVIINYGDGTFGKLAHLQRIDVVEGQYVMQGQQIGTCGGTPRWTPHIHYQTQNGGDLNSQSIASNFVDAEEVSMVPRYGGYYTSMNTYNPYGDYRVGKFADGWRIEPFDVSTIDYLFSRPFAMTYYNSGGLTALGHPVNHVHQASQLEMTGYNQYGQVGLPWIQDIANTSGGSSWLTLVVNPYVVNPRMSQNGRTLFGVVYPVHGRIRDYWRAYYSNYGYPASNEKFWPDAKNGPYVVQLFEKAPGVYFRIAYDTRDGSFNDPETLSVSLDDFRVQSTWKNVGCPGGNCGVGGDYSGNQTSYQFDKTVICKGVYDYDPWNYFDEAYEFRKTDGHVYSWINLTNVTGPLSLKAVWYYPSGEIAAQLNEEIPDPALSGYEYWEYYHFYSWVEISNLFNYGNWRVDFYINESLIDSKSFVFKEIISQVPIMAPTLLNIQ